MGTHFCSEWRLHLKHYSRCLWYVVRFIKVSIWICGQLIIIKMLLPPEKRKLSKYESRITQFKSNVSKRLFQLMTKKQTNLWVDLSSSNWDSVLKTAEQIEPHICMLSIHVDTFDTFNVNRANELKRIALKHDFLLLDDR